MEVFDLNKTAVRYIGKTTKQNVATSKPQHIG